MGWIILSLVVLAAGCSTLPTTYKPSEPIPPEQFSHRIFDELLDVHVQDGVVDYPAIQSDDRFPIYLSQLNRMDPNAFATQNERLAFWINAYNAFAIKGILDRYSPMT